MQKIDVEAMFQELRDQVMADAAADPQTKGMVLVGIALLENLLSDLHRSADALERIADKLGDHSK